MLIPSAKSAKWSDRPDFYYRRTVQPGQGKGPARKEKGTFRLAVVGDSITYGPYLQFDDVYAKKLERMFNLNALDKKLEVINYGVSGNATSHEVDVVKQALVDEADLVLLQITLNDPELAPLDVQHEKTKQRFGPFRPSPQLKTLITYWKTLGFVLMRLHNTKTHHEYKKYFTELFDDPNSWNVFYQSLQKIAAMTKAQNVPLMAVVFPLFGQNIDGNYTFKYIHAKIDKALTEIDVPHMDLLPHFLNIPAPRLQVIPGVDFHPNEIGHRLAAEKMYRWLAKSKKIPKEFLIQNISRSR